MSNFGVVEDAVGGVLGRGGEVVSEEELVRELILDVADYALGDGHEGVYPQGDHDEEEEDAEQVGKGNHG